MKPFVLEPAERYFQRILAFIENKRMKFHFCQINQTNCHGYLISSASRDLILLDPRKEVIATLIHECLHGLYPEYSETRICKMETHIFKSISGEQVKLLLQVLVTKGVYIKKLGEGVETIAFNSQ